MRIAVLVVLLISLGCLPGKRDNTPLSLDGSLGADSTAGELPDTATASDVVVTDTKAEVSEVVPADVTQPDALPADVSADAAPVDSGAVSLGGCTTDTQCNTLPFGQCTVGVCDLTSGLCKGKTAGDDTPCAIDLCTLNAVCQGGSCVGTPVKCEGNACKLSKCDPDFGCLETLLDGLVCNDQDACTLNDACAAGKCTGKQAICNDGDACTDDACDVKNGCNTKVWKKEVKTVACTANTASSCAEPGVCDSGNCVTKSKCEDSNPCSMDICVSGKCDHLAILGACPGGNADPCVVAACQSDNGVNLPTCATKAKCEDKVCNVVSCSVATGLCLATKLETGTCEDGDPCTTATACIKGQCKGQAVVCNDGNPCTSESCTAGIGCVAVAVADGAASCDDGSGCTTSDKCKAGKCAGTALNCDDGNNCTKDSCDPIKGCDHPPVSDGGTCGAGTCKGGQCTK